MYFMKVPDLSIPSGLEEAYMKVVQFGSASAQNVILKRRSSPARARFFYVGNRSLFIRWQSLYDSFTVTRRGHWTTFWESLPFGNHAGLNGYPGSGYSAFIYINAPRYEKGLSLLLEPPIPILGTRFFSNDVYPDIYFNLIYKPNNGFLYAFSLNFSNSSNGVFRSTNGGVSFSRIATPGNNTLFPVIYVEQFDTFYAFPVRFGTIMKTSSDGITWTNHTFAFSHDVYSLAYSPTKNLFIATGDDFLTPFTMTSPDGINWTKHFQGTGIQLGSVQWSDRLNCFLISGTGGSGSSLWKTYDGINLILLTNPSNWYSGTLTQASYGKVAFVWNGGTSPIKYFTAGEDLNFIGQTSSTFTLLFPPVWVEQYGFFITQIYDGAYYRLAYSFDAKNWAFLTPQSGAYEALAYFVPALGTIFSLTQGAVYRRTLGV